MNPNVNICNSASLTEDVFINLQTSQTDTSSVDSEIFDVSKSYILEGNIKLEIDSNFTHHSTCNIDDTGQLMNHENECSCEGNVIPDQYSQETKTNSWDTVSQNSLNSDFDIKEERTSCWDSIEALPPELPLLCNIAQQVNAIESGTLEMLVIDVDDTNSWNSDGSIPLLKYVGVNTSMSEELLSEVSNSHTSNTTLSSQLSLEIKHDNDTEVADVIIKSEETKEKSDKTFDYIETISSCKSNEPRKQENEEDSGFRKSNCNSLNHISQDLQEDPNFVEECEEIVLLNEQKGKSEKTQHFPNVRKSKSFSYSPIPNLECIKICKRNMSSSSGNMNQINVNEVHLSICNTTDDCAREMGDSTPYKIKPEDSDVLKILKQYTQPVESLALTAKSKLNNKNLFRNRIYECHIVSVNNSPEVNPPKSSDPQQLTSNALVEPTTCETEEEQIETTIPETPPEAQEMSVVLNEEVNEVTESAQALPSASTVKHRPIKQPNIHVMKQWPAQTKQSTEAWVLVDSEGNTQEVTPRDVNILLGGRSADSVVAQSTAHPMLHYAVERDTQSDTCRVPRLAPLIRESLLLLQQDDTGGEQSVPRRLSLERKAGNMLLYIGMDMNLVPSVRFIDVETEMVDLWRHSQDFNSHKFAATLLKEYDPADNPNGPADIQVPCFLIQEEPIPADRLKEGLESKSEIHHKLEEVVARYKELAQARDRLYHEERERAAQLQVQLANIKKFSDHQQGFDGGFIGKPSTDRSIHLGNVATQQQSVTQQRILNDVRIDLMNLRDFMIHSEGTVKQGITKYILDKNLKEQLQNAVGNYSRLQVESDQRANALAHELIDEQAQTLKNNRDSSEANIASQIKKNRVLEEENIYLLKKIEKLQLRLKQRMGQEESSEEICKESACIRNNDKLRSKLAAAQYTNEEAEGRQHQMQATIDELTDQVRTFRLEIENQKLLKTRLDADHQMEQALLKKEIHAKDKVLQDCVEVADVLVDDMESLKKLFSETGHKVHINWERLKTQGNGLTNLMHVCRGCVNELGRELVNVHNQLKLEEKDMLVLNDANKHLKTLLKEMDNEVNLLRAKCDQLSTEKKEMVKNLQNKSAESLKLQEHLTMYSQNTAILRSEVQNLRGINGSTKQKDEMLTDLEIQVRNLNAEKHALQEKCLKAEKDMWDTKKLTNSLETYETRCKELVQINTDLHSKVDLLHKLVSDTQNYPEKLSEMEKKYYKEVADKAYLNEKLDDIKTEQVILAESKKKIDEHTQTLEEELSKYSEENANLKIQLTNLNEMLKCVEYNNYSLSQQVETLKNNTTDKKSESMIQELQSSLDQMVHDKQELIKMLECNSKMTDSAQKCCEEKDAVINNLGTQYSEMVVLYDQMKLENAALKQQGLQLENNLVMIHAASNNSMEAARANLKTMDEALRSTNEKLQLTKHKFKEKEKEVEKQQEMIDSHQKTLLENTKLREQFTVLQSAVKSHQNLVLQRDKLVENQKEFLTEIENLHQNLNKRQKKYDSLTRICSQQAFQLKEMEGKLEEAQTNLDKNMRDSTILRDMESELNKTSIRLSQYENHILTLEREMVGLQQVLQHEMKKAHTEKAKMEVTIMKLREDKENLERISKNKNTENELKAVLSNEIRKRKLVENEMIAATRNEKELQIEKDSLKEQLKQTAANCNNLQRVYYLCQEELSKRENQYIRTTQEHNETMKEKLKEISQLSERKVQLKKEVEAMQKAMASTEEHNKMLEQRVAAHGKTLHELAQVKRKNENFESQLHLLLLENSSSKSIGALLEKQNSEVSLSLQATRKELEDTRIALRTLETLDTEKNNTLKKLEELKVQHSDERLQLLRELQEMESDKMLMQHSAIEISKVKQLLEKEQQDLSEKLLQAVRMLLEEKMRHQQAEGRLREMETFIMNLEQEKSMKEGCVKSLTAEIEYLKEQLNEITHDNDLIHEQMKNFEGSELQQKSSYFQQKVHDLQEKLVAIKSKNQYDKEKFGDLILVKEAIIMKYKEQIRSFEEKSQRLTKDINEIQDKLLSHRQEQGRMHKEIIGLQAEKRNLGLRLQEVEGHLEEEMLLRQQLEKTSLTLLDEISKLKFNNSETTRNEQLLSQVGSLPSLEISEVSSNVM